MRVFVALPVEGQAAEELRGWTSLYRQQLPFRKWTHPQDYHITLQFLGELPESRLDELHRALRGVQAGPLTLRLHGGGTFGPVRSPRVLWSDVTGDRNGLKELHEAVVQATRPLGFVPEERPYTAHITLARGYTGDGASFPGELLAGMPSEAEWTADRFVLMRTRMNESPMYETIGEYGLE